MSASLDKKTAIVTGGAQGLGLAIAKGLAGAGASVVIADINEEAAVEAASGIDRVEAVGCDVREEEQVQGLVTDIAGRNGGLDVMVANAGVARVNPLVEMPLEEWRAVLSVNLDGVFLCNKHAGAAMAAGGGGSIINVASIKSFGGSPAIGAYGAAKAGVVSLTKTAALELRDHGVRVNAICPGWVGTQMVGERRDQIEAVLGIDLDQVVEQSQGRLGEASEMAGICIFLASDRSSFCSGGTYNVDGGSTASLI